jgi:hypothetical protein
MQIIDADEHVNDQIAFLYLKAGLLAAIESRMRQKGKKHEH